MGQAGQLAKAPMMDPTKNPDSIEALQNVVNSTAQATGQGQPQPAPQQQQWRGSSSKAYTKGSI